MNVTWLWFKPVRRGESAAHQHFLIFCVDVHQHVSIVADSVSAELNSTSLVSIKLIWIWIWREKQATVSQAKLRLSPPFFPSYLRPGETGTSEVGEGERGRQGVCVQRGGEPAAERELCVWGGERQQEPARTYTPGLTWTLPGKVSVSTFSYTWGLNSNGSTQLTKYCKVPRKFPAEPDSDGSM